MVNPHQIDRFEFPPKPPNDERKNRKKTPTIIKLDDNRNDFQTGD
jgi:hypothetical protein